MKVVKVEWFDLENEKKLNELVDKNYRVIGVTRNSNSSIYTIFLAEKNWLERLLGL